MIFIYVYTYMYVYNANNKFVTFDTTNPQSPVYSHSPGARGGVSCRYPFITCAPRVRILPTTPVYIYIYISQST